MMFADIGWQSNWWEILNTTFMRHAFIAGALVAIAAGFAGYFVVVRRDAFAAHALAHIGFPGATGAILVGAPVTLGLSVFCVAGALAIGFLGKDIARREIATGTVLAFATAIGVLFNSMASRSTTGLTNVLFGNLLAVSDGQIVVFVIFTGALVFALAVLARPLLFASVDPDVAEARGLPVKLLGMVFMAILALAVAMAVQVVGTLLLFALLVTPPATALTATARPAAVVPGAIGVALGSIWLGLVCSAMFNLPPSFPIVALSVLAWAAVTVATRHRRPSIVVEDAHHPHHAPALH